VKVYVASSWRNEQRQQEVVLALRAAGHEVYDFRNPPGGTGFSWKSVDPNWQQWSPEQYREALKHPYAVDGFRSDMRALVEAEACVLVQPCGSSAHLELGHAVGAGKYTVALLAEGREAELMLAMVDTLALSVAEVVAAINRKEKATGAMRFAYVDVETHGGPKATLCVAKFRGLAVTGDLGVPGLFHVTHENTGYTISSRSDEPALPKNVALQLMFEMGPLAEWAEMDLEGLRRLKGEDARTKVLARLCSAAHALALAQEGGGQ
jgi:hypothetical protein